MSIYYDFTKIDGYKCPVKIVISRRGLGKTFGKIKCFVEKFVTKGYRFIYVVETDEMVKELTRNNGEKFWAAILEYYSKQDTSRKRYFYKKITDLKLVDDENIENEDEKIFKRKVNARITGGTIKINGDTAGYIVSLNSYGELKRNNFVKVKYILVDEFISEKLDKTTLDNPRKVSSIIQSIARLNNVNIYLLGNAIRKDDAILSRMGFQIKDYGFYKRYDEYGLVAILHFVNPNDYEGFAYKHNRSTAGRFAKMIGETNEEENKFLDNLPDSRRLKSFDYKKGGFSINIVKENTIVTLRELREGNIACIPFANTNAKNLYCMTEKEQGYILGYHIMCNKNLKQIILNMLKADVIRYYSEVEYAKLKFIVKGD